MPTVTFQTAKENQGGKQTFSRAGTDVRLNDEDNSAAPTRGMALQRPGVSQRPGLVNQKSIEMTPKKSLMGVLLKLYILVEAFTSKGLNHFNNVYFVTILEWSPFKASWIWFARDLVRFLFQTLLSAHVDKTENKKKILYFVAIQKLFAGIIMVSTTNFALQVIKGASDGFTAVAIWPCVTAMTLGVMGKTRFHKKHASLNLMVQYAGTFLSVLVFGLIAYAVYPNLRNIFYQNIIIAVLLFVITFSMPDESVTVDPDVASGGDGDSVAKKKDLREIVGGSNIVRKATEYLEHESDDEGAELVKNTNEAFDDENIPDPSPPKNAGSTMSIRDMYSDPGRGRSLIFLSLVYFGFHLVNATVLPLFGQFLGLKTSNRASLPLFTVVLLLTKFNSFVTTWILKDKLENFGYRNVLFLGCGFLAARLVAIVLVGTFTDNIWALGATTLLHGPGDATMHLMKALYSHLLSRKTGRFNLNMGIVSTFETVGSALSILLGGALATSVGYHSTFVILAVMVLFPVCCVFGVDNVVLTKW